MVGKGSHRNCAERSIEHIQFGSRVAGLQLHPPPPANSGLYDLWPANVSNRRPPNFVLLN
jgi:hypothetical protein